MFFTLTVSLTTGRRVNIELLFSVDNYDYYTMNVILKYYKQRSGIALVKELKITTTLFSHLAPYCFFCALIRNCFLLF